MYTRLLKYHVIVAHLDLEGKDKKVATRSIHNHDSVFCSKWSKYNKIHRRKRYESFASAYHKWLKPESVQKPQN